MTEEPIPFDHSQLSPRDQEVLRTFLTTDDFETRPPDGDEPVASPMPQPVDSTIDLEDEMLAIFATEVDEDLTILRGGLEQAERDEDVRSPDFLPLQQIAHKIRGSAAIIGCDAMSAIAHRIELVVHQIISGEISMHTGLYGLGHAVGALEMTLASVVTQKQEDLQPLLSLEQDFTTLGISLAEPIDEPPSSWYGTGDPRGRPGPASAAFEDSGPAAFDQLIQHTERLIEQQTALEHARKQVDVAFQELQTAQARLRRIEAFFSSMFMSSSAANSNRAGEGVIPSSSLVARILREAEQRTGRAYQFHADVPALSLEDATRWDELEMDRFSETNLLLYALNEAIGDIATATAQLQRELAHLDTLMGQHVATTQQIHSAYTQHFPQATRMARGLLVRTWEQQVIIPFTQVLRIDYQRQHDHDHFYTLNALLGFPGTDSASPVPVYLQPVLLLNMPTLAETRVGMQVDEVIGQVELLVKQPPAPLQRSGITGMAIDSTGTVLLVLDVPELIWRDQSRQGQKRTLSEHRQKYEISHRTTPAKPKILIVDDSVSIRRTLHQTLSQKDYIILEASDGREALEKIEEESPDLLLLDLEMPHMNGYDVLNVLRTRSLLPGLKIALLTSRASDKHKQRAQVLGAHKYLTKPCSDTTLLETVAALLIPDKR